MAPNKPHLLYSSPCAILSPSMWARLVLNKGTWQSEELSFPRLDDDLWLYLVHTVSIAFSSCILWWSKRPGGRHPCSKELNSLNNYMSRLRRRSFPRRWLQSQPTPFDCIVFFFLNMKFIVKLVSIQHPVLIPTGALLNTHHPPSSPSHPPSALSLFSVFKSLLCFGSLPL